MWCVVRGAWITGAATSAAACGCIYALYTDAMADLKKDGKADASTASEVAVKMVDKIKIVDVLRCETTLSQRSPCLYFLIFILFFFNPFDVCHTTYRFTTTLITRSDRVLFNPLGNDNTGLRRRWCATCSTRRASQASPSQ